MPSSARSNDSFLRRLIRQIDSMPRFRAGRESIVSEARDLFENACLSYIRDRIGDFESGAVELRRVGIDYRKGVRVQLTDNGTHILVVQFRTGQGQIDNLEQFFTDRSGHYNSKGYYDEATVTRFNETVYALLDEIRATA